MNDDVLRFSGDFFFFFFLKFVWTRAASLNDDVTSATKPAEAPEPHSHSTPPHGMAASDAQDLEHLRYLHAFRLRHKSLLLRSPEVDEHEPRLRQPLSRQRAEGRKAGKKLSAASTEETTFVKYRPLNYQCLFLPSLQCQRIYHRTSHMSDEPPLLPVSSLKESDLAIRMIIPDLPSSSLRFAASSCPQSGGHGLLLKCSDPIPAFSLIHQPLGYPWAHQRRRKALRTNTSR
jgi:hypothetical protein